MAENPNKLKKNDKKLRKIRKKSEKPSKLTPRQKKFINFYMIHRNATKAAKLAGYSEKGADVQGHNLLGNIKIKEKIEEFERKEQELLEKEYDLNMAEIRKRFAMIALGDLKKYASWSQYGLNLYNSEEIKETYGLKAIKIKTKRYTTPKGDDVEEETTSIQLDDRVKALTRLGENIGMFKGDGGEGKEKPDTRAVTKRLLEYVKRYREEQ